jgi:hypothetical protein
LIGATIEHRYVLDSLVIEPETEPYPFMSHQRKFVFKFNESKYKERDISLYDLRSDLGWEWNGQGSFCERTSCNRRRSEYAWTGIGWIWRERRNSQEEIKITSGDALAAISCLHPDDQVVGLAGINIHRGDCEKSALALDECYGLQYSYTCQDRGENGYIKRKAGHMIRVAKRILPKFTFRGLLLVATLSLSLLSVVILFQPHAPSYLVAFGLLGFIAAPFLLFLGLFLF